MRSMPFLAVLSMAFVLGLFNGATAGAASAEFSRIYPATCPGHSKAAIAFDPQMKWTANGVQLNFKLALKVCNENAKQFEIYEPKPEEYIEVYDISGPTIPMAVTTGIPAYNSVNLYPMSDEELREMIKEIYKTAKVNMSEVIENASRADLEKLLKAQVPSINKVDDELSFAEVSMNIPMSSLYLPADEGKKTLRLNIWLFGTRIPYNLVFTYDPNSISAELLAK